MAISKSPEWSVSSISTLKRPQNYTFTAATRLDTISIHKNGLSTWLNQPSEECPCFLVCHAVNSSSCPSPIAFENPSTKIPVIKLDSSKVRDDSTDFNSILCQMLQDPETEELGYQYYKKAQEWQGFKPEKTTLKLLVRYLVKSKEWGLILSLANDFVTYNVLPDSYTCSRLVSSCVKARKLKIADSLLEIFVKFDVKVASTTLNSALRGYNKLHMYGTAISLYEKLRSDHGVADFLDSECYCQIMKAYMKTGDAERVVGLFNEFESRNLVSRKPVLEKIYRILCESLGKSGRAFEALEYFRDMAKKGIADDSSIYSCLICSFASIREVEIAEELFEEAKGKQMLRDPELFLKLVLMYVQEGLVEKTLEVVNVMVDAKLKVSDCIFCAIVNGFSRKRGFKTAVRVYEQLVSSERCEPGQVTYASIINAYIRMGSYSKAEMVFKEMNQKGFDKCVVAYSSIIAMYGKMGRTRDATRLVVEMKLKGCEPNVWIYNSLLDMHGRAKNVKQVEKIWKEMKRRKVAPDKVSYTSVISAYNRVNEFETCVRYYAEYRLSGGVIDKVMAGIMVGVFSKMGRVDELIKLLSDMKSEGTPLDERLYGSALNALRDAGMQMQASWLQESFEGARNSRTGSRAVS